MGRTAEAEAVEGGKGVGLLWDELEEEVVEVEEAGRENWRWRRRGRRRLPRGRPRRERLDFVRCLAPFFGRAGEGGEGNSRQRTDVRDPAPP